MPVQAVQSEALRWACQAVAWLSQGLQLQGSHRSHPARYNALGHRFEQRFAFLQRHASPEAIPYEHLMHDMNECESLKADLLQSQQRPVTLAVRRQRRGHVLQGGQPVLLCSQGRHRPAAAAGEPTCLQHLCCEPV